MEQTVLYVLILTVSALLILLVGLVISYVSIVNQFLKLKNKKEAEIQKDLQQIYDDTRLKMQRVTTDAYDKSQQIIASVESYAQKQNSVLGGQLEESARMYVKLFGDSIRSFQNQTLKIVSDFPVQIQSSFNSELGKISNEFSDGLSKLSDEVRESIKNAYQSIEEEIEEYKKMKLSQIDREVSDVTARIAAKILSKEINIEEHEKLVMKALDQAKREGVFAGSAEKNEK